MIFSIIFSMKNFLWPTSKKVIFSLILFLMIPMFGTIKPMCLAIGLCDSYFGFIGIPAFYIFGGLIDIFEALDHSSILEAHLVEYFGLLAGLLPYLVLSYIIICILFIRRRKLGEITLNFSGNKK